MLLMVFVINMVALCGCGLAQTSSHKMKMDKDCCCCKQHNCSKNNKCKTNHALTFGQEDKNVANAVTMQVAAVHYFLVSSFVALPGDNFSLVQPVYYLREPFVDTSPPDLRVMYRSFLI